MADILKNIICWDSAHFVTDMEKFWIWLHKYVYKRKYENHIGSMLRRAYEDAGIRNENEFTEVLGSVLSGC